jgi:hypothetical protein
LEILKTIFLHALSVLFRCSNAEKENKKFLTAYLVFDNNLFVNLRGGRREKESDGKQNVIISAG